MLFLRRFRNVIRPRLTSQHPHHGGPFGNPQWGGGGTRFICVGAAESRGEAKEMEK